MTIDMTKIVLAVIGLLAAIVTKFLIPLLQTKLKLDKSKLTENQAYLLRLAISTAVTAAEQLYKSEEGQKKKAYVLAQLESQGYKVDGAAIDAAIEAAVYELHNELK